MKNLAIVAVSVALLAACKSTVTMPVSRDKLELKMSTEELICHVKAISNAQQLDFHHGTSQQSFGTMATFRLLGDKFEITLVNAEKRFTFELRAYDRSSDGVDRGRALQALAAFKTALLEKPKEECRS